MPIIEVYEGQTEILDALMSAPDYKLPNTSELFSMMFEPWPSYVYCVGGRVLFVPPDHFCLLQPKGASDNVWMVPGTAN